jgi:sugar diacid utilization regulator/GAF domain-containing protein
MSTTTTARVRPRPATRGRDAGGLEYRAGLHALADLATAASSCAGLDELLELVAATAASVVGVSRSSVYLPGERGEVFEGRAAHPADEIADEVRRLTVGGPFDSFTREIVATAAPVLIRDTLTDPRGAQSALRSWKVRSVLGVPLLHDRDVIGVMFLDNAEQQHPYAPAHLELAAAVGRLAGALVANALAAERLRLRGDTAARQNRLLRCATTADNRFSHVVINGGGLRSIATVLAELTGKPTAFYDARLQRVTPAGPEGEPQVQLLEDACGAEAIIGPLRDAQPGASAAIGPLLEADVRRRHLVAPVDVGERRWGWIVVMEHPARLNALDELLVRRAAKYAALELAAERRADAAAWDARSLLLRQLIRGTQGDDVRRSADNLGIDLDRSRVVAFVTAVAHRGESIDSEELTAALSRRVSGEVLATKGPEGVALLLEVGDDEAPLLAIRRVKRCLADACEEVGGGDLIAGMSAISREPRGVPRAYREAREVARCIDSFAGTGVLRVLAADDLGPGRLFVANGQAGAIDRFVDDVIGSLLTGEDGTTGLLRTLHVFYDTGRSVRLSAAKLGIHENTVRYRLARVHALTGLDVAGDAGDQLTVQMSLLVLRLQGHSALPSFDTDLDPQEETA